MDLEVQESKNHVPIWKKYTLAVNEAVQYFNLGEKNLEN